MSGAARARGPARVCVAEARDRLRAPRPIAAIALALGLVATAIASPSRAPEAAASLRATYEALGERFAASPFGRPLVLDSTQSDDTLAGEVHAVVEHPFARVRDALQSRAHWCDILILHVNVKGCHPTAGASEPKVALEIGRKRGQAGVDTYTLRLDFRVVASSPDALRVVLTAADGPLGTRDYHIELTAIPLDERRTLAHLRYEYSYEMAARLAVQGYLATLGRDRIGFSTARLPDGRAAPQRGIRGMVERNTMRIYLAIDAFLATYDAPPAERAERRMKTWFASTERYARQLREMDEEEYLAIKRADIRRQVEARR